jgi:murein DD-endopeptidase MepM/ murein hydrolase activator NlpD
MPSVGTAYVNVRVNTKGFEAGLDKMLARLSTKMEAAGTKLGKDFERGLAKTDIGKGLSDSIGKNVTKAKNSLDTLDDKLTQVALTGDDAGDIVGNSLNKITTESREAKSALGDLSGELKDVSSSSRGIKLGGIGGGGGNGLRAAAADAGFFGNEVSKLASMVPSASGAIQKLYVISALGGTALAGVVGAASAAGQGIFAVGANAAAAAPALGVFASGLLGIAQVGAVAAISMKGVGEALKAGFDMSKKAAAATGDATKGLGASTKAAADAARRAVEAAQRGVRDALRGVQDAMRGVAEARQALGDAYRDAARAASDATRRTQDAERALAQAHRETTAAQLALNSARKEAIEQLEDIAFATEDAALSEDRAALQLADAHQALVAASELAPDDRARVEAELAFKEADLNFRKAKDHRQDADREQREAAKTGVEGTEAMRDARQDLADAQQNEADAARDVADARREEGRVAEDNARRIRDAQQGVADAQRGVADAQQRLADAQDALADAQKRQNDAVKAGTPAMTALATATDTYQDALDKLSPSQKEFVKRILDMRDDFEKFSRAVAEPLFKGLLDGMDTVAKSGLVGVIQEGLEGTSEALGDVIRKAAKVAAQPAFKKSLGDAMETNNTATRHFGRAAVFLADAFVQVADAAGPTLVKLSEWVESVAKGWSETARLKNRTGELGSTIKTAGDRVGEFWGLAKELWRTLLTLGRAANKAANQFDDLNDKDGTKGYIPNLTESLKKFNDKLEKNPDLVDRFSQALKNMNAVGRLVKNAIIDPLITLGSDPNVETAFNTLSKSGAFDKLAGSATDAAVPLAELAVSILDIVAALSESGSIKIFVDTLNTIVKPFAWLVRTITDNPIGKKLLGAVAAAFALRRAFRLIGGVVRFLVAGLLPGLVTKLDNVFKARTLKGSVAGGAAAGAGTVAKAGEEAGDDTWQGRVLVALELIKVAIDTCCARLQAAMGGMATGEAVGDIRGAAPAAGGAAALGGVAAGESGKVGRFSGVMGKFTKVLGPGTKLMKPFSAGLRVLGGAFRFAMGPVGMIVLTLLPLLWPLLVKLEQKTGIFSKTLDVLTTAFTWLWDKIKEGFNWVKNNWDLLLALLFGPFGLAVRWIIKNWDVLMGFIKGVPGKIKKFLGGMWDTLTTSLRNAWNKVKSTWNRIVAWVKGRPKQFMTNLRFLWSVFTDKLNDAWASVKRIWNRIVAWVKGRPKQFMTNLRFLWSVLQDKLSDAWVAVKRIWGRIVTWVRERPAQFRNTLKNLWDVFKDKLNDAWASIKRKWESIKNAISKWPGQIKGKLGSIFSGLGDGLARALNWVGDKLNGLIGSLNSLLKKFGGTTIGFKFKTNYEARFAEGGPVVGPGGPKSDMIRARLSNGEHVLTAAEVHAMGGHRSVAAIRKAALRGDLPQGGLFGSIVDKVSNVGSAIAHGAEYAMKWAIGKFVELMPDTFIGDFVGGVISHAADKFTSWGKKKDEEAAAKAAKSGGKYTGPPGGWTYPLGTRYGITQYPNAGHSPSWSVDIGAPSGTVVRAATRGRVASVINLGNSSYGRYIVVSHAGGESTLYAHLRSFAVRMGQAVKTGQTLGYSDSTGNSTGPHLHFEVKPSSSTVAAMAAHGVRLGSGGVVTASNSGTLALLAEAGRSERVTPLDQQGFTPAERAMLERLDASLNGGGGGDTYNVHPAPGMDETALADKVVRRVSWTRRRGRGWR